MPKPTAVGSATLLRAVAGEPVCHETNVPAGFVVLSTLVIKSTVVAGQVLKAFIWADISLTETQVHNNTINKR